MGVLTLTPPPGSYTDPQTVTVSGPAGTTIIATTTGKDPVVVKTIASTNKLGPEYPYIQSIDDGKGRAIFDGAFSKYYNSGYSASLTAPNNRFLINSLNWIAKDGGKRLLVIGDRSTAYSNYNVKRTTAGTADFGLVFNNIPQAAGYTVTVKDATDYGGTVNPTYAELINYDVVLFMSASAELPTNQLITSSGAAAIAQARKAGIGIYVCTDNVPWYDSANIVLAAMTDATFVGSYDFSPGTTVGYNKIKNGDNPIFNGMLDTDIITASTSDSYVNQAVTIPETLPKTVNIPVGYTAVKFAVIDTDGNISFEEYGYSASVTPIIELCDAAGTTIETITESEAQSKLIYFKFVPTGSVTSVSGFIKAGATVIGTFNDELGGLLNIQWLDTDFSDSTTPNEITMPRFLNRDIYVELFSPLAFTYTWSFNRIIPNLQTDSMAKTLSYANEALGTNHKSSALVFKAIKTVVPSFEPELSFSKTFRNAYAAMVEDV